MADTPLEPRQARSAASSLLAVFMVIATILALLFEVPTLLGVWQGPVTYGFFIDQKTGIVRNVRAPEAALGVRDGMRALPNGDSPWRLQHPTAGSQITVVGQNRRILIAARHRPLAAPDVAVVSISLVATFTIIVFAGMLCYQRPGIMTVAFWLYAVTNLDVAWIVSFYRQLPEDLARPIAIFSTAFIGGWANYPLVWFALRFPSDELRSRRVRYADYAWSAFALAAFGWFLFSADVPLSGTGLLWAYTMPQIAPMPVAIVALLWVYLQSAEAVRQRTVWAIAGLVSAMVLGVGSNVINESVQRNYIFGEIATLLYVICPFALIYAVFRHQLLDISFVVNRALVFSTLTAFIVGSIGLADYVIGKFLSQTRAALVVEAAVTVGVGYALQRVHGFLEQFVDRIVFAGRHRAEKHIDRVIAGLAYAKTQHAVLEAMVAEPRSTLDLQSAGAFIVEGEKLRLISSHGWHVAGRPGIELDDPLARLLLSERKLIDISEARWHAGIAGLPLGSLQIAVPLFSRNDLMGIVFYSRHRNGSALDPEECDLLHRLCHAAAVAYEAVELAQARLELGALRAVLPA